MRTTLRTMLAGIFAFAILVAGAQVALAQDEMGAAAPAAPAENPVVNVAHFAPFAADVPGTSVTVRVNSTDVITDFVFGEIERGIDLLPAGTYTIEVLPTGEVTPVITGTVSLQEDMSYSLLAVGDGSAGEPLALVVVENDTTPPALGDTKVLMRHYAPFDPDVDNTRVDVCNDLAGAPVPGLTNIPYGVNSGFLTLPAGIYDLSIALAGTNCASDAFDLPPVALVSGKIYDVFAIGKNDAAFPLTVASISRLDFPSTINVAHLAPFALEPDGTSVTVRVNGLDVLTSFVYSEIVPDIGLPPGTYTVELLPTGTSTVAVSRTLNLESGLDYSLLAVGDNSTQEPLELVRIENETAPPAAGQAKVLIGHYAPFAPAIADTRVDICLDATNTPVPGLTNVPYGINSGYVSLPAGIYDLNIALAGTNCTNVALDLPPIQVNAGEIYDVFAIGKNSDVYPLQVVSISGLDSPATVTVGHFAPFAATVAETEVDVRVNGQLALTDVVYGEYFPNLVLPSGPNLVEIIVPDVNAAVADAIVLSDTFTLTSMSKYNLFVVGGANGWPLQFIATEISKTAPAGKAVLTVGHLAPFADTPAGTALDIRTKDGQPVPGLTDITYPAIADNLVFDPGLYDLVLALIGTSLAPVIGVDPFILNEGDVRDLFVIGLNNEEFPLTVVSTTGLGEITNLFLPLMRRAPVTVYSLIGEGIALNTLQAAVDAAGLRETLSMSGTFTVFAPTDDAFAKIPPATLQALMANPTGQLRSILLYHVLGQELLSSQITNGLSRTTLQGSTVNFTVTGSTIRYDEAVVTWVDVPAENGVLHLIDTVVIP